MQFVKRSSLLIAGNMVKLMVQLLLLFWLSRKLSVEHYGQYQSLWLYINVLSVVALFGLPALMLSSGEHAIKQWVSTHKKNVIIGAILLLALPLLYILLAAKSFSLFNRGLIGLLITAQILNILTETRAIKQQKETRLMLVNIFYHLAFFAVHWIWVSATTLSFSSLLYWLIALSVFKTLLLHQPLPAELTPPTSNPSLGKQWFYLGMYDVAGVLFKWIDKWVILAFVSVSQFAAYYNGSYEIPVFSILLTAVSNILLVEMAKLSLTNKEQIIQLFHRSAYFLAAFVFPAFCFLFSYHREVFLLIFSDKYATAIPVFLVSLLVLPVRITNYTAALQVYHQSKIILIGALLDLALALLLMACLYPVWGLPGLAAAFVISTYVQAAYYLWHTSALIGKPIGQLLPWRHLLLLLVFCVVLMQASVKWLVFSNPYLQLGAGLAVGGCLCMALLYFFARRKWI